MGVRRRSVGCHDDEDFLVDDSYCTLPPLDSEVECVMTSCDTAWFYSDWSDQVSIIHSNLHTYKHLDANL